MGYLRDRRVAECRMTEHTGAVAVCLFEIFELYFVCVFREFSGLSLTSVCGEASVSKPPPLPSLVLWVQPLYGFAQAALPPSKPTFRKISQLVGKREAMPGSLELLSDLQWGSIEWPTANA